jgi:hypothetical protein
MSSRAPQPPETRSFDGGLGSHDCTPLGGIET